MKTVLLRKIIPVGVSVDGVFHEVNMPDGCIGVSLIFKSKKSARDFDKVSELGELIFKKKGDVE